MGPGDKPRDDGGCVSLDVHMSCRPGTCSRGPMVLPRGGSVEGNTATAGAKVPTDWPPDRAMGPGDKPRDDGGCVSLDVHMSCRPGTCSRGPMALPRGGTVKGNTATAGAKVPADWPPDRAMGPGDKPRDDGGCVSLDVHMSCRPGTCSRGPMVLPRGGSVEGNTATAGAKVPTDWPPDRAMGPGDKPRDDGGCVSLDVHMSCRPGTCSRGPMALPRGGTVKGNTATAGAKVPTDWPPDRAMGPGDKPRDDGGCVSLDVRMGCRPGTCSRGPMALPRGGSVKGNTVTAGAKVPTDWPLDRVMGPGDKPRDDGGAVSLDVHMSCRPGTTVSLFRRRR